MDHELILKMIEEVDPSDTAKLDEINARVWCYLNRETFKTFEKFGEYFKITTKEDWLPFYLPFSYTSSRDALKSIRPDGYWFYISPARTIDKKWVFTCNAVPDGCLYDCVYLKTEELAELHAIIQAIAYERS